MNQATLSIVIVNYNTKKLTLESIESIEKNYPAEVGSGEYEVIVTDNASPDGSYEAFKAYATKTKIKSFHAIDNGGNIGFAAGNNKGISYTTGRYILFLNPDTVVYPKTLTRLVDFMGDHPRAGAVTCKVAIPSGGIDEASHRGFPTPWNGFTHFSRLERVFPKSHVFAGYTQGWKDLDTVHTVDAIVGAFMMVRREVGELVGWWDEDYFFYGEDLQFCYNIKKKGYEIYYIPDVSILHYGGVSSGLKKQSHTITTADIERKNIMQGHRFDAMRIFFKKNYQDTYPKTVHWLVHKGINFLHKRNIKQ
ncbi:MAG: glycosyltransferase family 2 protein [Candidatus Levyibacteriota bacterium]